MDARSKGLPTGVPGKRTLTMGLTDDTPVTVAQRKGDGAPPVAKPAPAGAGMRLFQPLQSRMERAFGADFSAVRIHEGPQAAALGALAYTQGADIHFSPGQYQPETPQGQELVGHELAHVVQQSQGRVRSSRQAAGVVLNDEPALEREADDMGTRAARGEVVAPNGASAAHPAGGAVAQPMCKACRERPAGDAGGTCQECGVPRPGHAMSGGDGAVVQRQPDPGASDAPADKPEEIDLPPDHAARVGEIAAAEATIEPNRVKRSGLQQKLMETQENVTKQDEQEENQQREREKQVRDEIADVEKTLIEDLETKITAIGNAIAAIEQRLPGKSAAGGPTVKQAVWDELERLEAQKKADQKEKLALERARARANIEDIDRQLAAQPQNRAELEAQKKKYGEFLSGTAKSRAAPGTTGPRAGESGKDYVVCRHSVRVGGSPPWRNNNPGNVQRSPSGGDPPGVIGVDKWKHYIFERYEDGQMAVYFDLENRRGGPNAQLRSVLRKYVAGNKTDDQLPDECGPQDPAATCVTKSAAQSYAGKVAGTAGLTNKLDSPLSTLSKDERVRLANAIMTWEGNQVNPGDVYTCADTSAPAMYRNLLGCDE